MPNDTLDAHLRLALARGLGPRYTATLLEHCGSAQEAAAASIHTIQSLGIPKPTDIHRELREADIEREHALIAEHNVSLLTLEDEHYPTLLKHIHDPPPLLYVKGSITRNDTLALAIVGSRKATAYGTEQADRFASAAAAAGLTIVSGGARGIDTAAHQAALRAQGRTLAAIGSGLAAPYPHDNAPLFDQIAQDRGAVISELPMATPPNPQNFPRRNRIISGLSLGVLVIEAAKRSGALITARLAAEDHNREVLALPGRVDSPASAGCHQIIQDGSAKLVTSLNDILDALGETGQLLKAGLEEDPPLNEPAPDIAASELTPTQQSLFDSLTTNPITIDHLVQQTNLPIHTIQSELTALQLRGLVERLPANRIKRRR